MQQAPSNSQRWFSRFGLVIVIAGIIVGAGGVLIWQSRKSNNAPVPRSQNLQCSADKALCAFFAWYTPQTEFTVHALNKSGDQDTDTILQVDGQNAYLKLSGMISYEVLRLGATTTYTKTPDGTWWKYQEPNSTLTQYLENGVPQLEAPSAGNQATIQYTKKGKAACGEQTCLTYEFKNKTDGTTVTTLWFDEVTYQLRRTLTVTSANAYDATYDFSPITISVPSPVQDLPKNQFVGPNQDKPLSWNGDSN